FHLLCDLHIFPTRRSSDLRSCKLLFRLAAIHPQMATHFVSRPPTYLPGRHSCPAKSSARQPSRRERVPESAAAALDASSKTKREDRKITRLNSSHEWISYA